MKSSIKVCTVDCALIFCFVILLACIATFAEMKLGCPRLYLKIGMWIAGLPCVICNEMYLVPRLKEKFRDKNPDK